MVKDYQETEMSQRARKKLEEIISPDSPFGKEIKFLTYDPRFRERVNNSDGSINLEKAYEMLGVEDQEIILLKRCIQWNLSEEQAHDLIKYRYKQCYGPGKGRQNGIFGGMHITMSEYPKWCETLAIKPDPNFPDWGNQQRAKQTIEGDKEKLELG